MGLLARFRKATSGLILPITIAVVLATCGGHYLRIVSLDYRTLGENLRLTVIPVGLASPENDVRVTYATSEDLHASNGLHFTYADLGGEVMLEPPAVPGAWVDWGAAALGYGALPLVVVCLVGWACRRRARRVPGTWTPDRLSRRAASSLAALAFLPFTAFAIPFALGLSMWVLVEAFVWIEWFDALLQLTPIVLVVAGTTFLMATLLTGALLLRAVLRDRSHPANARGRWRSWLLWGGVVLPVGLAVVPAAVAATIHATRLAPVLGDEVPFERTCSSCHTVTAPLALIRTPDQWRTSLESTCFEGTAVEPGAKEDLIGFVVAMRSFPDAWIFRTRCQQCHGHATPTWEGRTAEDWQGIVERIGRYSPHYYNAAIQAQVVKHLVATWPGEGPGVAGQDGASVQRTVQACTSCHFFSRNADAYRQVTPDDAIEIVRRMSERMAVPLTEAELLAAAATWRATVLDPGTLSTVVPHDRAIFAPAWP